MTKLELYKTAYSPLFDSYVGIKKVRYDDSNNAILDCEMYDSETNTKIPMIFRENELTQYCL